VHIAELELVWGDQEDLQPVEPERRTRLARHSLENL
jgi:hypothetical protein